MLGPAFSTVFFLSMPGGEERLADIPSNQLPGYKTSGYMKTIPPGNFAITGPKPALKQAVSCQSFYPSK